MISNIKEKLPLSTTIVSPKIVVEHQSRSIEKFQRMRMKLSGYVGVETTVQESTLNTKKIIRTPYPIKSNTGISLLVSSIKGEMLTYSGTK